MEPKQYEVEVISGPEGACISINNHRVAGPKPWGGGRILHSWRVSRAELLRAIPDLQESDDVQRFKPLRPTPAGPR